MDLQSVEYTLRLINHNNEKVTLDAVIIQATAVWRMRT